MTALRILLLAAALGCSGGARALPVPAQAVTGGPAVEAAQAFCGPVRCFARPFWRYRSGAGFRPFRGPGFLPARPFRFSPFGFRRFGPYGRFGGPRFRGY